jgi:antitoxin component of RelBE/YafQ-DinJ toxin-antitoxin module
MASVRVPVNIDATVYRTLVDEADSLGLTLTAYLRMVLIRHAQGLGKEAANDNAVG